MPWSCARRRIWKSWTRGRGSVVGGRLTAILAALLILSVEPGCDGFFVDPVLTGMAVGPAATIQTGDTIQMVATGTYNDGSQKKLSNVHWNSDTPSVGKIDKSGLVTGVGPGKTTINAAADTVTGTATITVTIGGLTAIQVTNKDGVTNITFGEGEKFVATGTANGQQIDITDSVTWSTSPATISNVSLASTTGLLVTTSGPTTPVQFQVIATDTTTGISGFMNFTVHP
jgi:hypothetical protein